MLLRCLILLLVRYIFVHCQVSSFYISLSSFPRYTWWRCRVVIPVPLTCLFEPFSPLHMVEMFWVSCNPRPSVLCVISVVLTSGRSWSLCAAGAGITWAKARCPQVSLPRQRSGCRPLRVPFSTALVYRSLCTVIPV